MNYELNRQDVKVIMVEKQKIQLENRFQKKLYFYPQTFFEHWAFLGENQLMIEECKKDWIVFRNGNREVYLLTGKEKEKIHNVFYEIKHLKIEKEEKQSRWIGYNIYGYCNGFFDREHYGIYKHVIEAVGEDWLLARDIDNNSSDARVYLAYFNDKSEMEKYIKDWSSEEEKENWHPDNIGF